MDKKVLLIADDDEMNRMIIKRFLQNDYQIMEAADGKETMEILHSSHVDALLLDIIMPEMDGLEVLSTMKSDKAFENVGILVATSTKEKTEREALSLEADDIVSKPYDPVVIKKRLGNILAVKTLQAQKEMLQNKDTQKLMDYQNEMIQSELSVVMNKIDKFADIINANKSNYKLVDEIVGEIKVETKTALEIIQK